MRTIGARAVIPVATFGAEQDGEAWSAFARDTGVRLRILELATQTLAQAAEQLPSSAGDRIDGAAEAPPVGMFRRMANWWRRGSRSRVR